ncbi:unnamed protein product [Nyctereutes procyonoides]|uniref:(raccoon dog) hypothetical protein n=1 Tax=Nyctereutes procyonoides TaxID=34880 RepID=A0A811YJ97_NYCPR|nr:unnamed protein product [Nyctereutes procyonoides]
MQNLFKPTKILKPQEGAAWMAQQFSAAFSPGRDPGDPGSSPALGSLRGACFSLCLCLCPPHPRRLEMGKLGSEGMAGAKAKESRTESCAIFSGPVAEEEGAEVVEQKPGDVEMEVKVKAGPWFLNVDLYVSSLEAIQLEVDTVNFGQVHQHYLEQKSYIIRNIPSFWVSQEADTLRYTANLEVKDFRHPRIGSKFKFLFQRNPLCRNKLITFIHRNQGITCSFFTRFSDHNLPECERIAEIIKEDLWPNLFQYYLLHEGASRARFCQIRKPMEIPWFQSR